MEHQPEHTATTVVVGAARGIGAAVARRAALTSQRLILADVLGDEIADLAGQLRSERLTTVAIPVDLSDTASIDRLVAESGDVHRVALVAGIMNVCHPLQMSFATFESVLRVNLIGTYLAAQGFAKRILDSPHDGSIVAVTSTGGLSPVPHAAAYGASKAGLRLAMQVLALETMPRVRINTVCPGGTDTDMPRTYRALRNLDEPADPLKDDSPRGRRNTTDEVAAVIEFLLSPDSAGIALRDIVVDGGSLRGMN